MRYFLPLRLRRPCLPGHGPVVLSSVQRREPSRDVLGEAVRFGPYWGQTSQEGPAALAAPGPSEQLSGPSRPSTTALAPPSPYCGRP